MSFDRGDVVWIDFNPQRGHEQAGRRPAVVISPAAYNRISNCMIVCPITSNRDPWPWKVPLPDDAGVAGAVLADQAKSIDAAARRAAPADATLPPAVMGEVLARLETLLR